MPIAGHVVALDLEQVNMDLGPVPLDEVLAFSPQHGAEHRAYARNLRQFVPDVASLDHNELTRLVSKEQLMSLRRVDRTAHR